MISGATRTDSDLTAWNPRATSLNDNNNTGPTSYSNPWSFEDGDHSIVDRQTVEACYKWLDRVVSLCQQPRLNLKNSPPYLLDTIPDVYEKLENIIRNYSDDYKTLSQLGYFRVFLHSLTDKCKRTVKLFKDAGDKIFDVYSHARFRLVKLSLIFSHLLKDLEALFPQNTFCPGFRITKPDAARWWSNNFSSSVIVPWPVFQTALLRTFRVDSADQLIALRNTIDLTCNKYVSIFEFDVFIRLFQPWSNILETWKALAVLHPGYMAFMTYDEVKAKLKQYRSHPGPGTYVFRLSCTKLGQWAIGYVTDDKKILQTIIQNKSLAQALLDGEREGFYLYPNGRSSPPSLLHQLVHDLPQVRLQVTQEQYQVYCEMGSTFELCKICDENNKDVQLEPCGHLICKHCLLNCRSAGCSQTCPFCRMEIKGIEDVIVDPYRPGVSQSNSVYNSFHTLNLGHTGLCEDPLNVLQSNTSLNTCQLHNLDALSASASAPPSPRSSPSEPNLHTGLPPPLPPRNPASVCSLSLPNNFKHTKDCAHNLTEKICTKQPRITSRALSHVSSCSTNLPTHPILPVTENVIPLSGQCQTTACCRDPCTPGSVAHAFSRSALPTSSLPTSRFDDSRVRQLNYAQLDLNPSDSDQETDPTETIGESSSGANEISNASLPRDQKTLPDTSVWSSEIYHLSNTITPSSKQPGNTNSSILISRLLQSHADLDETTANLLLSITHNDLNMATQVWKHFMLRPDSDL